MLKSPVCGRRALGIATLLLVLSGCESSVPREVHPVADRVHQAILAEHPNYRKATGPRALTGCFNWANSMPDEPDVRYLAVASRRGGLTLDKLVNRALSRCEARQRRDGSPCVCQAIDRMGRNVLEPPDDFIERFE